MLKLKKNIIDLVTSLNGLTVVIVSHREESFRNCDKIIKISNGQLVNENLKLDFNIGIIGIGYVGLPLAVEFGKIYKTIAFDTNKQRVNRLNIGYDDTLRYPKVT